jgi:sodium bicarbonate transporter 10
MLVFSLKGHCENMRLKDFLLTAILQKGSGYHLDLFVLSLLIIVGSFFGLPWFVAATVESLTNVGSLKMESETSAPGEKPTFLGVREQRVSNLMVFTTIGFSVLLTPVLKYVPMPVLYGVFLYMGFSALMRMELFHRILLLFMPLKYQPDYDFLRHVPLRKVHLFTMIQVLCLAILWTIKSIPATAIAFPLMVKVSNT